MEKEERTIVTKEILELQANLDRAKELITSPALQGISLAEQVVVLDTAMRALQAAQAGRFMAAIICDGLRKK